MNVWVDVEAFLVDNDKHKDACSELAHYCGARKAEARNNIDAGMGRSVFPLQPIAPTRISFNVPADAIAPEVQHQQKYGPSSAAQMGSPQIAGCIQYTTPVTPGVVHQTPFSYILDAVKPENPAAGHAFQVGVTVDSGHLALRDFGLCGSNAD